MSYQTIVLELSDAASCEARIRAALVIAQRFEARLIGVHIMPPPIVPVGYGEGASFVGPEILEAQREAERAETGRLKLHWDGLTAGLADATWHAEEGEPFDCLGAIGRTADLTITGQVPVSGIDALPPQMVEDLLHVVGGPVLMLPASGAGTIGSHPLLAWNGRREAARAVKDALPFLVAAERVTILAAGDEAALTLAAVDAQLTRHGVRTYPVRSEASGDIGQQLMDTAAQHGCDLLVMGAYGHSRLRELMLGGATRHIVRHATMPVLFSG